MNLREITYREAINEAMYICMLSDENVILLGEDIAGGSRKPEGGFMDAWGGPAGATKGLLTKFGSQRVIDTPISESGFVGMAAGSAMFGLRPVVDLNFITFTGVCFDQITNQLAKIYYLSNGQINMPVTIRTVIGGGIRAAAQHSLCTYSTLVHFPGLKVVAPSDPYMAKGLLISAIRDEDPVIVLENQTIFNLKGPVPEGDYSFPIGSCNVIKEGTDITMIGISRMVNVLKEANKDLENIGISTEIIDLCSLSPLDESTIINSVKKTGKVIIVDEANPKCGMASEISAIISKKAFDYLDAPVTCVTAPHTSVPFSPVLEDFYLPNSDKIIAEVKKLI